MAVGDSENVPSANALKACKENIFRNVCPWKELILEVIKTELQFTSYQLHRMDQYLKFARKFNKGVEILIGSPQQFRIALTLFIAASGMTYVVKEYMKEVDRKYEKIAEDDRMLLEQIKRDRAAGRKVFFDIVK
nr:PREDICTED: uncharacterized protein LOC109029541 isoform X2 [Bemisia tabaci]